MSRDLSNPKILFSGGYVVHMDVCEGISESCNELVLKAYHSLLRRLHKGEGVGVEEVVPTYTALTVFYDPRKVSRYDLKHLLEDAFHEALRRSFNELYSPRRFVIPVVYGGAMGPDLPSVASKSGLSQDEVVKVHTSRTYRCFMLGFTPGFLYLGVVDDRIAVPRLKTPRVRVPQGSVGVAGLQTGVYGVESPGGWRIIGRTPLKTFDPGRDPPTPVKPGDTVRFIEVGEEDFRDLKGVFIGDYV